MKIAKTYIYWGFPLAIGAIIALQSLVLNDLQTGIVGLEWEAVSDLLLFLPVSLFFLFKIFQVANIQNWMAKILFYVSAILYVSGHGIHLAANQINNFINSIANVSPDIINVVYLWDELLGHWFIHVGLASMLLFVVIKSTLKDGSKFIHLASGFLLGAFIVVAAIEGHSVWIWSAYCLLVWMIALKISKKSGLQNYILSSTLGMISVGIVWYWYFGDFIELSALLR